MLEDLPQSAIGMGAILGVLALVVAVDDENKRRTAFMEEGMVDSIGDLDVNILLIDCESHFRKASPMYMYIDETQQSKPDVMMP